MTAISAIRHPSLDDLVGKGEDSLRDRQSKRLGGLQVDDKLEPGRLLNRQIGRSGALQDFVDEPGGPFEIFLEHLSIGQQTAFLGKLAPFVDGGQSVLRCERQHPGSVLDHRGATFDQNSLVVVSRTRGKGSLQLFCVAQGSPGNPHAERLCEDLDGSRARTLLGRRE